ncbi:transmembrane channel-like protein isoform X2 [Choristoneura fumiferana]|uniref:transmembrane channel-like protein isoform X2 n=1 Tax=Choristoneura fumiferana TaxID=7141 RepID=UPI003D15D93E
MDKAKEKGILKLEPRPKERTELTPQGSYERVPSSPQPSVDRLSVTWADPSMASTAVNLFHLPTEIPVSNEVKFSPAADGSEDEDYSASISAVLRQRRCSVRRSRKGRRRTSSPFLPDDLRARRRSSVFTTSSGETAISMEDQGVVTQEEIFKNIRMHKEVLSSVKQQPLGLRRKLKLVHLAKGYIKCHEGQLQERLAQSKSTRDIYARFNILLTSKLHQLKREAANTSNLLIPWELRIKEIESHFGSVVASYFTFLRWLFWVNLVIGFILLIFVIIPECLTGNAELDRERKTIRPEDQQNASNLLTLWEFEGFLKVSPIFYGYYSSIERSQYRMPLAYFLTGLVVYIYSFVAILKKMAENSRMSKLSEKEDECIFSWKLFTGWDFMIGNAETAHNRAASVILGFKEALLEEAEKKKDPRNWRIISKRAIVNVIVLLLLATSVFVVINVVSEDRKKPGSWLHENLTTIVVTTISIIFPVAFEYLGLLEHYHPRRQLRWQLARIMVLNLLNLFSLIFALFSKIQGMSEELEKLKPSLNESTTPNNTSVINDTVAVTVSVLCTTIPKACLPCDMFFAIPTIAAATKLSTKETADKAFHASSLEPTSHYKRNSIGKDENNNVAAYGATMRSRSEIMTAENLIQNFNLDSLTIEELEKRYNITGSSTESDGSQEDTGVNYYDETDTTKSELSDPTDSDIRSKISNTFSTNVMDVNQTSEYTTSIWNDTSITITDATDWTDTSGTTEDNTIMFETTLSVFDDITQFSTDETSTVEESTVSEFFSSTNDLASLIDTTVEDVTPTPTNTYYSSQTGTEEMYSASSDDVTFDLSRTQTTEVAKYCPDYLFNCTTNCGEKNVTHQIKMSNCKVIETLCFETKIIPKSQLNASTTANAINASERDIVYLTEERRKIYNLSSATRSKLMSLCWETMFGQELVKLTMMDLVFLLFGTLFMDFFRALFVRYMNRCWCWDLEKKFPEYGDFKIAENILHLINNQGMVWMGMFFSPGLVIINVFKLVIMMYLRSWAVMTCNVPHEVVFRVSKSNNFYLGLLLTMLFLCVLPVGYSIVWVKPSWHCGPFSELERIYEILTNNLISLLPKWLKFAVKYIASPAIVIPLLVLLILIIYYLISLTNSLREANNDLKIQLRRERTEERRKMFQMVDTRRKGQSAMDNTPFARWKKALPGLPMGKSIDSDDRKTATDDDKVRPKPLKKKGNFLANLVGQVVDKKSEISELDNDPSISPNNGDETDTDFHETLPREVLKIKDITIVKPDKKNVEFKTKVNEEINKETRNMKLKADKDDRTDKAAVEKRNSEVPKSSQVDKAIAKKVNKKQTSETSTHSKQSDVGSIIPVITISTTESDDDFIHVKEKKEEPSTKKQIDLKSLRRQSSVDSSKEQKVERKKSEEGHKFQYSL